MGKVKIQPSKYLNPQISNNSIADFATSSTRLTDCKICKSDCLIEQLIQPCQCQQPVHQKCLKQFINLKLKNIKQAEQDSVKQFPCEICFQRIYYKVQKNWQCMNCEQICQVVGKRTCFFVLNIFFFIIALILAIIAILMKVSPQKFNFLSQNTISLVVNVGFFVIAGILMLITIYNLSIDFMLVSRLSVQKILSQKIQKRKKSYKKSQCQIQILQ